MRGRTIFAGVVVGLLLVGAGGYATFRFLGDLKLPTMRESCTITAEGTVDLQADQLANAATIAAVGIRRDLPERAIVVALATAFQESKLRNLTGGDRDSIGLFQQRPSQGWGTPDQIADPRYAAGEFYDKLMNVHGWEDMRVTDAAQAVQISAHPGLYEQWAAKSQILATALHGRVSQAVACTLPKDPAQRGSTATGALLDALRLDWGSGPKPELTDGRFSLAARDTQAGWRYAHWLVARAEEHGVSVVRFAGLEWNAKQGSWAKSTAAATNTVVAEVYS